MGGIGAGENMTKILFNINKQIYYLFIILNILFNILINK